MAIRASTAHSVVFYLKMGLPLTEAGRRAMEDLNDLGGRYVSRMNFIVLDAKGQHAGFSTHQEQTYVYMSDDMAEPEIVPRTYVPVNERWGQSPQGR